MMGVAGIRRFSAHTVGTVSGLRVSSADLTPRCASGMSGIIKDRSQAEPENTRSSFAVRTFKNKKPPVQFKREIEADAV